MTTNPQADDRGKADDEAPAAPEVRHLVGEPLPEGQVLFEGHVQVAAQEFVLLDGADRLLLEGGDLARVLLQEVLQVLPPEAV